MLTAEVEILVFLFNLKFSLYQKNLFNCPHLKDKIIAASTEGKYLFDAAEPPKKRKNRHYT